MPKFHVERSILIEQSAERVFDVVSDFGTWTEWSPWLCSEPDAEVIVSEDPSSVGSLYRWSGEIVGAGEIEHLQLDRPERIEDEIRFSKPYKSTSNVGFTIRPRGDQSELTWYMNGKLPFLLGWMRSQMETFIGMDYERGLKMLRDYLETGTVLSRTRVVGEVTVPSRTLLGWRDSSALKEIGTAMDRAFKTAIEKLGDDEVVPKGEMVSVYHSADLRTQQFDFTSGYCIETATEVPDGLARVELPAGRALHVEHIGSYDHLGNAWSAAHQYARYKKLKLAKADSFEIYRNDPTTTPEAELHTDIYLMLR